MNILERIMDAVPILLIGLFLFVVILFIAQNIDGGGSWGYFKAKNIFEQCIADDTFTRAECVIIAGGGK